MMKAVSALFGIYFILVLAFWGGIAYVAYHFISKWW